MGHECFTAFTPHLNKISLVNGTIKCIKMGRYTQGYKFSGKKNNGDY